MAFYLRNRLVLEKLKDKHELLSYRGLLQLFLGLMQQKKVFEQIAQLNKRKLLE